MKKYYLIFGIALLGIMCPVSSHADMKVNFTNKKGETFQLDSKEISKITFSDGMVSVFTSENTPAWVLSTTEMKEITYDMKNSGISAPSAVTTPKFEIIGETLYFTGEETMLPVEIYSMSGQKLIGEVIGGDKGVSIASLDKGIYVAKAGKHTFKFVK